MLNLVEFILLRTKFNSFLKNNKKLITFVSAIFLVFLPSYCHSHEIYDSRIEFTNNHYGACSLTPFRDKEKLRRVFQKMSDVKLDPIEENRATAYTSSKLSSIIENHITNLRIHRLGFYEIYSSNHTFLGVSGFFIRSGDISETGPELCCYLLPEHQRRKIGSHVFSVLVDYAFQVSIFDKIEAEATVSNPATKILNNLGFIRKYDQSLSPNASYQVRYEMTRAARHQRGLSQLCDVIRINPAKFIPRINYLATAEMERNRDLWSKHFGKGVPLCTGGSSTSFLRMQDLKMTNLADFHGYRTDKAETTYITEIEMKKFLFEEGIISQSGMLENLHVSFCLGSHEGLVRLGRCIYNQQSNNGLFCPYGAYGLIVHSLGTMKPIPYKVHMIDIERRNGEKLNIDSLEKSIDKYPSSRTLIFEMKTLAGATYTDNELSKLIALCKSKEIFLISDSTHSGMEFNNNGLFPDFVALCFSQNYHDFGIIYTGSKVYGLERGRVGFFISSTKNKMQDLHQTYNRELGCVLGEIPNLPFEIMHTLFNASIEKRTQYKRTNAQRLRYNMNLMLAYIHGIHSPMIDSDLKEEIVHALSPHYTRAIPGVHVVYKPVGGMHMKVDMSSLQNKYFFNIRMFNSEIFSHALNKTYGIATLHAFDFLDPSGFTMRLSFMVRDHVHRGMRALRNFIHSLTDVPQENKFFPDVMNVLEMSQKQIELEEIDPEQNYWDQINTRRIAKL